MYSENTAMLLFSMVKQDFYLVQKLLALGKTEIYYPFYRVIFFFFFHHFIRESGCQWQGAKSKPTATNINTCKPYKFKYCKNCLFRYQRCFVFDT